MVDSPSDKNSAKDSESDQISVGVSSEMSDVDIDAAIAEEDPEFLGQLKSVGEDAELSIAEFNITDEDAALADEKLAWQNGGRFKKIIFVLFPPAPLVSFRLKRARYQILAWFQATKVRVKNYLFFLIAAGREKGVAAIKMYFKRLKEKSEAASDKFRYLNWKMKLAFFGLLVLVVSSGLGIYLSLSGKLIPQRSDLFVHSLADVADQSFEIPTDSKSEPLYENLRVSQNLFLLPRLIVNLKRSQNSGSNPMGAFEFFVEGMTQEVLVEVKDRETEVRDQLARTVEEFTFDQVDSADGKKLLAEKIRKDLNSLLTSGKVRKVLIKTAVVNR